ncbi:tail assembly chaperone gp38 [Burkholderia multivorans]|uniref:Tail assembly chaperone gp38 n=1 Tax=Burkholderia multivorans TaxID=87883 RepID=A0ABD7LKU1_9BURK|nr:tail assembly chaperone gp38 [Burkholderia multivorans]
MLIHQYDAETGQYISSHLADVDPKNPDRWLVPAFSTLDPLPERSPRTWPFYRNGAWKLLPDHRGQVLYRQDTGEPAEILAAGTTPEAQGLTEIRARRPSTCGATAAGSSIRRWSRNEHGKQRSSSSNRAWRARVR